VPPPVDVVSVVPDVPVAQGDDDGLVEPLADGVGDGLGDPLVDVLGDGDGQSWLEPADDDAFGDALGLAWEESPGAGAGDGALLGDFDGDGDGEVDQLGLGFGEVVGLGVGVGVGDGFGLVGAFTAGTTRVAAKNSHHQIGDTFTTSPAVGACTILPLPM
jgi:hypothetical protein